MTRYETPQGVAVHDGFPNPASDTALSTIDLNKQLIQHSIGTYFMRLEGNEWSEFGIFHNDVLIIDRVLTPRKNDLVIWWEGESFRLGHRSSIPSGSTYWGVVTTAIHQYYGVDEPDED